MSILKSSWVVDTLSPEQPALHTSRRHDEAVCSNVEITNTFILVKLSWNRFNDHNYANLQSTIPRLCSLLSKWTHCVSRYGGVTHAHDKYPNYPRHPTAVSTVSSPGPRLQMSVSRPDLQLVTSNWMKGPHLLVSSQNNSGLQRF